DAGGRSSRAVKPRSLPRKRRGAECWGAERRGAERWGARWGAERWGAERPVPGAGARELRSAGAPGRLPAAFPPGGQVGAFPPERGVVPVPGQHHGLIGVDGEDPLGDIGEQLVEILRSVRAAHTAGKKTVAGEQQRRGLLAA